MNIRTSNYTDRLLRDGELKPHADWCDECGHRKPIIRRTWDNGGIADLCAVCMNKPGCKVN